jgi:hypothetical protein
MEVIEPIDCIEPACEIELTELAERTEAPVEAEPGPSELPCDMLSLCAGETECRLQELMSRLGLGSK